MSRDLLELDYRFQGKHRPPANGASAHGPFVKAVTAAAGSPTVQSNAGFMELAHDAQNEVQNLCLYWGDELGLLIDKLVSIDIWAKLTANLPSTVTASFGVASARNDTPTSMSAYALFQCAGNNNAKFLSSDGTNTVAATLLGHTLSTTVRRFQLDFAGGVLSQSAPNLSKGGKANVGVAMANGQGLLRRCLPNTPVNLSAYSSGLQFLAQLQKTSSVSVATLSIERILIRLRQG